MDGRSRIAYAVHLRPFSLEDTQNHVRYQLHQAGSDANLLSDDAVRAVFQASRASRDGSTRSCCTR